MPDESPEKPGPKAETVVIEGDWTDALRKAVNVKRPEGGWPNPKAKKADKPEDPEKAE